MIEGVKLTKLKRIIVPGGDVLHAIRRGDEGYVGFGEAYFSSIENGVVKGWKRHRQMTLNLVVPSGAVTFIIYDDRIGSFTWGQFQECLLSVDSYYRLTVPPMVWLAFQGVGEASSLIMNLGNIPHDPKEVDRKDLIDIKYKWGLT